MQFVDLAVGTDPIKPTEHVFDGRRYRIRVWWVGRAEAWMLDLAAADGTPLLSGLPIRVGQDLLRPHVGADLPGNGHGALVAFDTSGSGTDPTRDDLNTRVRLIYVPASEVT